MKALIHKVDCELYKTLIHVYFDREAFCHGNDVEDTGFEGATIPSIDFQPIHVFIEVNNGELNIPVLCHESYHVSDFIFDKCNIEYKQDSNNEAMAYLIEWVSSKILDCFHKEINKSTGEHDGQH
jgi:hypothetical protein